MPLVSGGIEGRGMETVLRRLLGPYGLLEDIINGRSSIYDLLRPLSGQHFNVMADKIRDFIGRVRTVHPPTHSLTHSSSLRVPLTVISSLECQSILPLQRFDAVGWAAGIKGHPACKNRVVECWHSYLSAARCRLAYGPADATASLLLQ